MNFGNFARHMGERDDGARNPVVRYVAYGVWGLSAVILMLALLVLAGRRPPPHRLPEAIQTAIAPPVAMQFSDITADVSDGRLRQEEELLRRLRSEVESEAALVVALRDQVDTARRDLTELQRQQADLRSAEAELRQGADLAMHPAAGTPAPERRGAEVKRAAPQRSRPSPPPARPKVAAERHHYSKPPPPTLLDRMVNDAGDFLHRATRWIGSIGK